MWHFYVVFVGVCCDFSRLVDGRDGYYLSAVVSVCSFCVSISIFGGVLVREGMGKRVEGGRGYWKYGMR